MSKLNTYPKKGELINISCYNEVLIIDVLIAEPNRVYILFNDGSSGWHYLTRIKWEYTEQLEFKFNP